MRFSTISLRAALAKSRYLLPVLAILSPGMCRADLYFQGFETDTSGWFQDSGGDGNGSITRVPSGGGTLGLTAADGGFYGETHNNTNAYQAGYGSGGFSYFEGDGTNPTPYPGSPFSQSIDVYIDVNTASDPISSSQGAYWIDMFPSTLVPDADGCGQVGCGDEHNFRLAYTGSSVNVLVDGGGSIATLTTSGWYTFQSTYAMGPTPSSDVLTNMNVFDSLGVLQGTIAVQGNSDGEELLSSDLGGPGLVWLPVWENGFSGDVLGIDDVRAAALLGAAVPEPSNLILLAVVLGGLVGFREKARRQKLMSSLRS